MPALPDLEGLVAAADSLFQFVSVFTGQEGTPRPPTPAASVSAAARTAGVSKEVIRRMGVLVTGAPSKMRDVPVPAAPTKAKASNPLFESEDEEGEGDVAETAAQLAEGEPEFPLRGSRGPPEAGSSIAAASDHSPDPSVQFGFLRLFTTTYEEAGRAVLGLAAFDQSAADHGSWLLSLGAGAAVPCVQPQPRRQRHGRAGQTYKDWGVGRIGSHLNYPKPDTLPDPCAAHSMDYPRSCGGEAARMLSAFWVQACGKCTSV